MRFLYALVFMFGLMSFPLIAFAENETGINPNDISTAEDLDDECCKPVDFAPIKIKFIGDSPASYQRIMYDKKIIFDAGDNHYFTPISVFPFVKNLRDLNKDNVPMTVVVTRMFNGTGTDSPHILRIFQVDNKGDIKFADLKGIPSTAAIKFSFMSAPNAPMFNGGSDNNIFVIEITPMGAKSGSIYFYDSETGQIEKKITKGVEYSYYWYVPSNSKK